MPEMLDFCGKTFRVFKSAHKTCDTATRTGGRWMKHAVHLEDLRCDGSAHGGCQADCLLFWKYDWIEPADTTNATQITGIMPSNTGNLTTLKYVKDDKPQYICQATQLPYFTKAARWWDPRQYWKDLISGNVRVGEFLTRSSLHALELLIQKGYAYNLLITLYNRIQILRGDTPFPYGEGGIESGAQTPSESLNLLPGERVRVKDIEDIRKTLDSRSRNRGMWFDPEMVPFCGGTYTVRKRISKIIDESSGNMIEMKTPCIMLEGVVCTSRYSRCRMFCPRAIPSYWREIWLERDTVDPKIIKQ